MEKFHVNCDQHHRYIHQTLICFFYKLFSSSLMVEATPPCLNPWRLSLDTVTKIDFFRKVFAYLMKFKNWRAVNYYVHIPFH